MDAAVRGLASRDPDDEWHSLDSTINRAHQHAAGAKGGARRTTSDRSRGGPSTKVHLVVDAVGLPLTFEITEGQRKRSATTPPWWRSGVRCSGYGSDRARGSSQA